MIHVQALTIHACQKIIILPITTIIVLSDGPIKLLLGLPVPQNLSSSLLATKGLKSQVTFSSLFPLPHSIIFPTFVVLNPFHSFRRKGKTAITGRKENFLPFHLQAEESIKYEDKSAPSSGQVWMFTSRYYLLY